MDTFVLSRFFKPLVKIFIWFSLHPVFCRGFIRNLLFAGLMHSYLHLLVDKLFQKA